MNLNDYYLVKCFNKQEHMDAFNNGTLYLNSTVYYWKLENTFQQDFEGLVFRQEGKGYLIAADSEFGNIVKKANSLSDIMESMSGHGEVMGETTDFSIRINGFISCFYLLPKKDVQIGNGVLKFTNPQAENDLRFFFQKYLEDNNSIFAGLYDASRLCRILNGHFDQSDYDLAWGDVEYKDLKTSERISAFRNGEIEKIVFTKPLSYQYQKEFRFFISSRTTSTQDPIIENGIDAASCLVGIFNF